MERPEVSTKYGRVCGIKQNNTIDSKNDFLAFKGIPYAQVPVGELRFRDSVPPKPWTGVKNATEFGPNCLQFDLMTRKIVGSEDCLYLNVYTKFVSSKKLYPVMFYIHGGGFYFGSGDDTYYGADYLMRKDIVLVTINYRLGIFGFLNLEDELAPGNQGLKDQIMALQWVQDNIANFGGDPENVTIFGESAGGASVHYLTLSPLSKGLFHKAISQSGVALNPWASVGEEPKIAAFQLCSSMGKNTQNSKEALNILKTTEANHLIEILNKLMIQEATTNLKCVFGPCMDAKSPKSFMPKPLEEFVKQGAHVPYLLGHTDRESILICKMIEPLRYDENGHLDFERLWSPRVRAIFAKYDLGVEDVKQLYFKKDKIDEKDYEKLIDFSSDVHFNEGIHRTVKTQVDLNSAPTYFYQFTYDKGYSIAKLMYQNQKPVQGASHMDDLLYLFSMKYLESLKIEPFKEGSHDFRVMEQMLELWTNFARTGRPTPTTSELLPIYWRPVIDSTVIRYLNIGQDLRMGKMLNLEEKLSYKKM
ncbi:hypothetical protein QAD02_023333 [Eretmocerus hayati]|uniref:Uncharacterized protein n=1 Tax=Eretmocerus hayati TaxID=131215 RepID=A0ACC2PW69_9HYME|nr:hypothetical protein QAD02_023333 [Eretmocerus hayati]